MRKVALFGVILTVLATLGGAVWFEISRTPDSIPFSPNPAFSERLRTLEIGDTDIQVAVADTPFKRTLGLSGTMSLSPGTGMLFVFESEGERGFWMKEMLFSIDMIWISSSGEVVDVTHNASPESYPQVFSPSAPAQYVLEVPAGFSVEHNVQKGLKVSVETALR